MLLRLLQHFESKLIFESKQQRKVGRMKSLALSPSEHKLFNATIASIGAVVSGSAVQNNAISKESHLTLLLFIGWPSEDIDGEEKVVTSEAIEAELESQILCLQVLREIAHKHHSVVHLLKNAASGSIAQLILWVLTKCCCIELSPNQEEIQELEAEEKRTKEEYEMVLTQTNEPIACSDDKVFQPRLYNWARTKQLDRLLLEVLFSLCLVPERLDMKAPEPQLESLDQIVIQAIITLFDTTPTSHPISLRQLLGLTPTPYSFSQSRIQTIPRFQLQQYVLNFFFKVLSVKPYLVSSLRTLELVDILFSDYFFAVDKASSSHNSDVKRDVEIIESGPLNNESVQDKKDESKSDKKDDSSSLLVRTMKRNILDFLAFAATCDSSTNGEECRQLFELLQSRIDDDITFFDIARCLTTVFRHRLAKTQESIMRHDGMSVFSKLIVHQQKAEKEGASNRPHLRNSRIAMLRLMECLLSSDQLQIIALSNKTIVSSLFSLLREQQAVRQCGIRLITGLMSVMGPKFTLEDLFRHRDKDHPISSDDYLSDYKSMLIEGKGKEKQALDNLRKAKWSLFTKYVELLPRVLTDDLPLVTDLLQGIRLVLKRYQRHHQDIFRRRQCFIQVINLLSYIVSLELVEKTSSLGRPSSRHPKSELVTSPTSPVDRIGLLPVSSDLSIPPETPPASAGLESPSMGSPRTIRSSPETSPRVQLSQRHHLADRNFGTQVCISVVQTLTSLMAGNKKSQDHFRQNIGYDLLGDLLLRAEHKKPSRQLYAALFDMLVDGDFFVGASKKRWWLRIRKIYY